MIVFDTHLQLANADNDSKNMYDLLVYTGIYIHLVGTNQIERLIYDKVTGGFPHFEKLKIKRKSNAIQEFSYRLNRAFYQGESLQRR